MYVNIHIIPGKRRHPDSWLPSSGPKKRCETSKTAQKCQNLHKSKETFPPEILVARIFTRYDTHTYIYTYEPIPHPCSLMQFI